MRIRIDGASTDDVHSARASIADLARTWDCGELNEVGIPVDHEGRGSADGKSLDPVSLAALVVSLPSAALAVVDLADRMRKRRRAQELIDNARALTEKHVTVHLFDQEVPVELATLTSDQLLEISSNDSDA